MKLTQLILAAMLSLAIAGQVVAQAPCENLLPGKISPCEGSDFCGVWGEAKWDGVLPHCLAVEGSGGDLRAVYAWGRAAKWGIASPGWGRHKAHDTGDMLKMKISDSVRVEYELIGGQLQGYYYWSGGSSSVVLDRLR